MKKTILLLALNIAIGCCAYATTDKNIILKPEDISVCESFKNPIGLDIENLTFSWKLPQTHSGLKQTAYQIVVAKTPDSLESNPLWDSGKVQSSQSVKIPYSGEKMKSSQRLYWRVRIWNERGDSSKWSDVSFFETGLLSNADWKGKWISTPEKMRELAVINKEGGKEKIVQKGVPPAQFRKEFTARDDIKSARLYVTCRGIFQAYINGKKVGDDFWGTGWTDYNTRIQTNSYDVTNMLYEGKNAIGAILGNGWYAGQISWYHIKRAYGDKPELLAQLELTYEDGSTETITTDETWKTSLSPITFSDIYAGEEFDARLANPNWIKTDFDDSTWAHPETSNVNPKKPLLEPRKNFPIKEQMQLYPLSVKEVKSGSYIFDFGQNMVGWVRISIPADPGRVIKLRFAEMLNQDGTMYTQNYRSARSTDFYTCAGYGVETWEPQLTYHGFRYVELSGFPKGTKPSLDWVKGIVVNSEIPPIGSFVCSSAKINKLQSNIQWGQRGNFFSTPTDCPQRDERLGWTGDAQAFIPTAAFNMDVEAFFSKWTRDMRDAQTPDGRFSDVAPKFWDGRGNPAWADAGVICPWEIYLAYGNKQILRDNYEAMKKWVDFQKNSSKGLIRPNIGFGDWLQPGLSAREGTTPRDLIGTAYFVRTSDIVAKTAKVLGNEDDAKKYAKLAEDVRSAFVKKYMKSDFSTECDTQTSYLLALAFDILPEDKRQLAFNHLIKALEMSNWHLGTGFVGTPLLNPVLTKFGRTDIAYRLLNNETYPSWIYPINQGATTMWERWNSYSHENGFGDASMNSFNHYAYGAIGQWLYKDVAGLWYDESAAGYKNIIFAPKPGGGLTFAAATHQTPYGLASSNWRVSDAVMEWQVTIPPNATGTIVFPTKNISSIRLNGKRLKPSELEENADSVTLKNVQSGAYQILLRY